MGICTIFQGICSNLIYTMYQESGRHADTLDAITRYLDMGVYSEWDEERKLEFLTRELKGKRPLVPPTIEVRSYKSIRGTTVFKYGYH